MNWQCDAQAVQHERIKLVNKDFKWSHKNQWSITIKKMSNKYSAVRVLTIHTNIHTNIRTLKLNTAHMIDAQHMQLFT